mmetsp:Transcript_47715/g.102251  ORF Transcript_47715/g.102251 Transcript_47715/m.102251 type:complete len:326 (+) Transcript_47715:116-1093(+)
MSSPKRVRAKNLLPTSASLLALEKLHDPLFHLRVRLAVLDAQGLLRNGTNRATIGHPPLQRLPFEVMPIGRSHRVDHHLPVDGASHVLRAIDHRPGFDPDLRLLLLRLLRCCGLLQQGRQVPKERGACHRLYGRGRCLYLWLLGLVESFGSDLAGGQGLQLVALDETLHLYRVPAVTHVQRHASQRVRRVVGGPVLQGGALEDVPLRCGDWIGHESAAELAESPTRHPGLVSHAKMALPVVRRYQRGHVVVVVGVLLLLLLHRRGCAILARGLHGEHPFPLLRFVLRVPPLVLFSCLAIFYGGRIRPLSSGRGQREGKHLHRLHR